MQPIKVIIQLNTKLLINATQDVTHQLSLKRIDTRINNIIFITAHLLDARYYMANFSGCDITSPFNEIFKSVNHVEDSKKLPPLKALLIDWQKSEDILLKHLEKIDKDRLQAKSPAAFPVEDSSVFGAITFLISHESYHIGQVALLRKALGLPSMNYS
jgi:hypothetical protein